MDALQSRPRLVERGAVDGVDGVDPIGDGGHLGCRDPQPPLPGVAGGRHQVGGGIGGVQRDAEGSMHAGDRDREIPRGVGEIAAIAGGIQSDRPPVAHAREELLREAERAVRGARLASDIRP